MPPTEEITILRIGTDEAVRNIQDLKDNITVLKSVLKDLDIGSEEYNRVLMELNVNQNALKDAMHYTATESKSAEEAMHGIAQGAAGLGNSYNALVARMKTLREEWRSTEDVARRNELGRQINEVNQKLKELDASTGSFKRNVGDYEGALKRTAEGFNATAGSASAAIGPINRVTAGFKALAKTPVAAVLGLIALALYKVVDGLKSSEDNLNSLSSSMSVFRGLGDQFTRLMQRLGSAVAGAAEWLATYTEKMLEAMGVDTQFIEERRILDSMEKTYRMDKRNYMIEDAEMEAQISDLRLKAIDRENYSASQRASFQRQAISLQEKINAHNLDLARQEEQIAKQRGILAGNSIEENDALAAATANRIRVEAQGNNSIISMRKELNRTLKEAGKEAKNEEETEEERHARLMARIKDRVKAEEDAANARKKQAEIEAKAAQEIVDDEAIILQGEKELTAELDDLWDKHFEHVREQSEETLEKLKEGRTELMFTIANTASSILGSVADIYESLSENDEKAAEETKGIRIASAVIDTISGAIAAYMSAQSLNVAGVPIGTIVGALNAATVIAAGTANIAKIRSTNVSKNAASSAASLASFSTPTVTASIPQTTIVKGATDEAVLNQMGQPARVYILQSDIEAAAKSSKARVSDSSFR